MAIMSAALTTFTCVTTPLVPSANYLFLTYCIPVGFGVGFIDCLSVTILPEFFDKYVGLATGFRLAMVATGSMIYSFLFPLMIEAMGWKKMFYCMTFVGPVLLFYAFFYKPAPADRKIIATEDSDTKATGDASEGNLRQRRSFLRDHGFQLIVIGCVPFLFAVGVPMMFMV